MPTLAAIGNHVECCSSPMDGPSLSSWCCLPAAHWTSTPNPNPTTPACLAGGFLHLLGTFTLSERKGTLLSWSLQQMLPGTSVVRASQFYERYDPEGRLEEKHWLDVRFSLVERGEFQALAEAAGFRVAALYGSYGRSAFHDETSPFMIWVLENYRFDCAGT
jgi:hypothetical protein